MSSLYARLRLKQEQLARLRTCQGELNGCRQEFYNYEHVCVEPALSSETWQGTLADAFDSVRESGILSSYHDIEDRQFSLALQVLADKIRQIEAEIAALKAAIAAAESSS